jgi:hypothetical protein
VCPLSDPVIQSHATKVDAKRPGASQPLTAEQDA